MRHRTPVAHAGLVCLLLLAACGATTTAPQPGAPSPGAGNQTDLPTPPPGGWNSHAVAPSTPPPVGAVELQFTGAVRGSSTPPHESCDWSNGPMGYFVVKAEGDVAGRPYFVSIGIVPYHGPGSYELAPPPPQPLEDADYLSTSAPLAAPSALIETSGAFSGGFLNFLPKMSSSYMTGSDFVPTMTVAPDQRSGWLSATMTAGGDDRGVTRMLKVTGRFQCGAAFEP